MPLTYTHPSLFTGVG